MKLRKVYEGFFMKKIILLSLVFGLVGCDGEDIAPKNAVKEDRVANVVSKDNKIKEIVKKELKDPLSAQFRDIKGQCGYVNAKNSYGGYSGFEQFIVLQNREAVFMQSSTDNLNFYLRWKAHCEPNKSTSTEQDLCVMRISGLDSLLKLKQLGAAIEDVKKNPANTDSDLQFNKIVDRIYISDFSNTDLDNPNIKLLFASEWLNECLKH
ncbi:hypothetical protein [Acinetobacter geminorum]|uniref:hypothetical protein n=1 Tax=Acinetobacter geminorum TaxID=2730922 RepID=UPI003AF60A83